MKLSFICILLLSIVSCKPQADSEGVKIVAGNNIIGENNRAKITLDKDKQYLNRIGKLSAPDRTYCTASLIGKNLILTAAHCAFKEGKKKEGTYTFNLRLKDNQYLETSEVNFFWSGTTNPEKNTSQDWAIGRLDKNLGEKYGYFGARPLQSGDEIFLAGYGDINADRTSMYEQTEACKVEQTFENGTFYHSCDMGHGDSGAPIYICDVASNCTVVALNIAQYEGDFRQTVKTATFLNKYANVGLDARIFIDIINAKRADEEAGKIIEKATAEFSNPL